MADKYINVKDKNGIPIARLYERDGITKSEIENRQNDESTLTISILKSCDKCSLVTQAENTFTADGREYTIIKPDTSISEQKANDGKTTVQINAVETFYLLKKKFVTAYNSTTGYDHIDKHMVVVLSNGALQLNVNSTTVVNPYNKGTSAYALFAILYGTGWSVGTVDADGTHDLETDKMNVLENIQEVQKLWGGILMFDSINKTVSLRDLEKYKPYNGFQVRYGKNIKSINANKVTDLVTRLYVYGKDNLNIASDNNGLEYIDDFRYTNKVYEGILFNTDIDDQRELKNWGIKQIAKICQPQITITTELIDLRTFQGYTQETFQVNDMVDIINADVLDGEAYRARIIYWKYDFFHSYSCSIEVGEEKPSLIDKLKYMLDTSDYVKKVYSPTTNSISSNSINLSGTNTNLTKANTTNVNNIVANRASITDLYAKNIVVDNLIATKATITDLTATNINVQNLYARTAQIDTLVATKATIADLNVTNNLVATKASISDLNATNANVQNLYSKTANIENLVATKASVSQLTATQFYAERIDAGLANVNTAMVNQFTAVNANIGNLNAGFASINNLVANKASIAQLTAVDAKIQNIYAGLTISGGLQVNNGVVIYGGLKVIGGLIVDKRVI